MFFVVTCDVSVVCVVVVLSSSFTLINSYVSCDGYFFSLRGGDTFNLFLWGFRYLFVRDVGGWGSRINVGRVLERLLRFFGKGRR